MKLALTLPIEAQETLTSYVSRIAALNGSYYVQDFCVDMRLDWRGILKGDQRSIDIIAGLVDADPSTLLQHSIRSVGGDGYRYQKEILTKKLMRRRDVFVCLDCFRDDLKRGPYAAFKRIIWDLDTVQACPLHSKLLVEFPRQEYPRDGQDYFGNITDNMNLLSEFPKSGQIKTTAFAHYQQQRLVGRMSKRTWLDKLDFDVAISFATNLGLLFLYGPNVNVAELRTIQCHFAGEKGYEICTGGDEAIIEALKDIQASSTSPKGGFYPDLGFFMRWLQRVNNQERHKPVIDLVRSFIFDYYAIQVGEQVLGKTCSEQKYYNWNQIAEKRGIHIGQIYRLRDSIAGDAYRKQFPKGMFENEFKAITNDLEMKDAALYLNIHPQRFGEFVTNKYIQPSLELPRIHRLYAKSELDRFLSSLNVYKEIEYEQEGFLSLGGVSNSLKIEYSILIKLLQSGRLKHTSFIASTRGIAGIRINRKELEELIRLPKPKGYCRATLKSRLRISTQTVTYLIKYKLIASTTYSHPRTGKRTTLVQEEDVQDFLIEHASLGLLAHKVGMQARHVSSRLKKKGIYQMPFPKHLSMIYRRADLPHDLR